MLHIDESAQSRTTTTTTTTITKRNSVDNFAPRKSLTSDVSPYRARQPELPARRNAMWSRWCTSYLLALTCLAWSVAGQQTGRRPPNILFVLMDDLGYSDVGYRDGRFHTPTLDGLWNSDSAIRFNRSYTPPNCGPSRAALLSGIYPWRLGLQVGLGG